MKTMFKTAIAAAALIGAPGIALAQTHGGTTTTYSAPATQGHIDFSSWPWHWVPGQTSAQQYAAGVGSAYTQTTSSPNDVGQAGAGVNDNKQTFTLTGEVNKDCSFYAGGSSSHAIALNTIGIRTQNTDNVSQAFNQAADITASFNTATAGCNTNNTVAITTTHGGKLVNGQPGDYDGAQFTAEIPYGLDATWQGVGTAGAGQNPTTQEIKWTAGQPVAAPQAGGAWRSAFNMAIVAPAQSKGLVAGTYEDTITVTLAAS